MTEQWKIDYDGRQYALMADQLRRYENGAITLSSLVPALEALLGCLQDAEESWKNQFRSKWGILEDVYAAALDQTERGQSPSAEAVMNNPEYRNLVGGAVADMKRLLADRAGDTK